MERPESSELAAKRLRQDPDDSQVPGGKGQASDVAPLSEAEVTRIVEQPQADPTFLSAELRNGLEDLVAKINAGHWTPRMLRERLIVGFVVDVSDDGHTKLASALRNAKANGIVHEDILHVSEEAMLLFWK